MALNDLIAQLKQNAAASEMRRQAGQKALGAAMASSMGGATPSAPTGGGGAGAANSSKPSPVVGGATSSAAMPASNGKAFWPAVGERHQHTDGYGWAKWSGDINVPGSGDMGNPVKAYGNGVVSSVKSIPGSYGNHIRIKHPDGTETLYAHLSKMKVKAGQRIKRGQLIGRVGSTGNSSGPHLHFEIK